MSVTLTTNSQSKVSLLPKLRIQLLLGGILLKWMKYSVLSFSKYLMNLFIYDWLHVPMSVTSLCVQAWPMLRCCIRWSMATACLPLQAAPHPSMTSWWSVGIRTPWRGQPLRHSRGSLRTSSPSRILNTRRRRWPTDPRWWSPESAVLTPSCTLPSPSVTAILCMHGKTTASLLPCPCWYAGVCGVYVMKAVCRGNVTHLVHVSLNSRRGLDNAGDITGE